MWTIFCLFVYLHNIISIMIIVIVYMKYGVKISSTNIFHFFFAKLFLPFLPQGFKLKIRICMFFPIIFSLYFLMLLSDVPAIAGGNRLCSRNVMTLLRMLL